MLDLLKAAAAVGRRTGERALPPSVLRFTLEYGGSPNLDAERARIEALLEGSGFDLFEFSDEDPALLVLQFPNVERQQSPDFLFATADELVEALGLVSATPEVDAPYSDVETSDARTESIGGAIMARCRSSAPPPPDPDWAIRLIRAEAARQRFGVSGAGVRIGQPDTGVARHDELAEGIDAASGCDFTTGRTDPVDPLLPSMRSPGHGTGVASVAVSRGAGVITGAAPGATLVPIRCVDSVIIGDGVAVARAVDHARAQGCRVVSMSLGGPFSSAALRRAIERAVRADMIVIAAAGNCVRWVVYPARDPNVIAAAGVNSDGARWLGTCRGSAVDVAAPAENVHIARRLAAPEGTSPGPKDLARIAPDAQGTSFASALTAGVAALWLERFGFEACREEARRRDASVQELFRAALRATAQAPDGWDRESMGAGIVDAEALLALPLAAIPRPGATDPENGPGLTIRGSAADIARHQAEAEYVGLDRSLRADPDRGAGLETPMPPEPSPRLAGLIGEPEDAELPAPALIAPPATPPAPVSDALRRLAASRGGELEAAASISAESALERLRDEGPESILTSVGDMLQSRRARSGLADAGVQDEAMTRFRRALVRLSEPDLGGLTADGDHRFALEAMVRLTGRPALRITDDIMDLATNPNTGEWAGRLLPNRARWMPAARAVGRIDVKDFRGRWTHAGTGFVLPGGRVMTNRHVLDVFADPLPAAAGEQKFRIRRRASIIFDPDAKDEATRFEITAALTAGRERIGRSVDLAKLDMAILKADEHNGQNPLPAPVDPALAMETTDQDVENILVIGYPARPGFQQAPGDASQALAFWDRVAELYGDEFGVKYISPGMLMSRPGELDSDPSSWAFSHDATTFAGNSGSAVIALDGAMTLCGLHFGGSPMTLNLAHDITVVRGTGDGVFDTSEL